MGGGICNGEEKRKMYVKDLVKEGRSASVSAGRSAIRSLLSCVRVQEGDGGREARCVERVADGRSDPKHTPILCTRYFR